MMIVSFVFVPSIHDVLALLYSVGLEVAFFAQVHAKHA